MRANVTSRRPNEDWADYVQRLEAAHLQALGERKQQNADALEEVAAYTEDPYLRIMARSERAAAHEFLQAVEDMEGGQTIDI